MMTRLVRAPWFGRLGISTVGVLFGLLMGCGSDGQTSDLKTGPSSCGGRGGEGGSGEVGSTSGMGGGAVGTGGDAGAGGGYACEPGRVLVNNVCVLPCVGDTAWLDVSGHGHDGTFEGFATSPWIGNGTPQDPCALQFDGQDDLVRVLDSSNELQFTDAISVEVWAFPERTAEYYEQLVGTLATDIYGGYAQTLAHPDGYVQNPNTFAWYTCPSGACPYWADAYSNESAMIASQWYHIAATYSTTSGFSRLYVNGVLQVDMHQVSAPIQYSGDVETTVGNNPAGDQGFKGRIGAVRIWPRELTSTEVANLFARDAQHYGLQAQAGADQALPSGVRLYFDASSCCPVAPN